MRGGLGSGLSNFLLTARDQFERDSLNGTCEMLTAVRQSVQGIQNDPASAEDAKDIHSRATEIQEAIGCP